MEERCRGRGGEEEGGARVEGIEVEKWGKGRGVAVGGREGGVSRAGQSNGNCPEADTRVIGTAPVKRN